MENVGHSQSAENPENPENARQLGRRGSGDAGRSRGPGAGRRRVLAAPVALVGLAALLLAGCDGDGGGAKGDASARAHRTSGPAHAKHAPASRSASATPRTSRSPHRERAADGRDFGACRDRSCEVEVETGDTIRFAPKYEANTFTVGPTGHGRVDFVVAEDGDSPLRGWVGGTGNVETGDIHVHFERTHDGRVVLTFRPRHGG